MIANIVRSMIRGNLGDLGGRLGQFRHGLDRTGLQHGDGAVQLEVALLLVEAGRRRLGGRVDALAALALVGVQRVLEAGLAEPHAVGDVLGLVLGLGDFQVGLDAGLLDRAARRREVARRGQLQGAVGPAAQRDHGLHRALAEAGHADQLGAMAVLQGAGDDLGRRGRAGLISTTMGRPFSRSPGLGVVALDVARIAAALADHLAAVEEQVRDAHGLVEQAAGIVAQVEDQPLHVGVLGLQLADRGLGGRRWPSR
jgi:hypothetical protein